MKGKLILEDGTIFEGKAFGYLGDSTAGAALRRGDGDTVCVQPGYSQPDESQ